VASILLDSAGGVSWFPDESAIAFSGSQNSVSGIYYYDLQTDSLRLVDNYNGPLSFSSDSALLAAGGFAQAVWSVPDFKPLTKTEEGVIDCLQEFKPDSHNLIQACVASGSDPFITNLLIWDWKSNRFTPIQQMQGIVRSLSISKSGADAIVALGRTGAKEEDQITVIEIESGREVCNIPGYDFALASEADLLVVLTPKGSIGQYNLDDCTEIVKIATVSGLAVIDDPNGKLLFLAEYSEMSSKSLPPRHNLFLRVWSTWQHNEYKREPEWPLRSHCNSATG
jgi:hypothetical protein